MITLHLPTATVILALNQNWVGKMTTAGICRGLLIDFPRCLVVSGFGIDDMDISRCHAFLLQKALRLYVQMIRCYLPCVHDVQLSDERAPISLFC